MSIGLTSRWKRVGVAAAFSLLAASGAWGLSYRPIFAAESPLVVAGTATPDSVAQGGTVEISATVANNAAELTSQNVTLTITLPDNVTVSNTEEGNVDATVTGAKADTSPTVGKLDGNKFDVTFETPDQSSDPVTTKFTATIGAEATAGEAKFGLSAAVAESDAVTGEIPVTVTAASEDDGGGGDSGGDEPAATAVVQLTQDPAAGLVFEDFSDAQTITYTVSNATPDTETGNITMLVDVPDELVLVPNDDDQLATVDPLSGATVSKDGNGFKAELPGVDNKSSIKVSFDVMPASEAVENGSYPIGYTVTPTTGEGTEGTTPVRVNMEAAVVSPLSLSASPDTMNVQQGAVTAPLSVEVTNPNTDTASGPVNLIVNVPSGMSLDESEEHALSVEGDVTTEDATVTDSTNPEAPGFTVALPSLEGGQSATVTYYLVVSEDCLVGPAQVNYEATAEGLDPSQPAATDITVQELTPSQDVDVTLALSPATSTITADKSQQYKFTATNNNKTEGADLTEPLTFKITAPAALKISDIAIPEPPEGVEVGQPSANGISIDGLPAGATVDGTFTVALADPAALTAKTDYTVSLVATNADGDDISDVLKATLTVDLQNQTSDTDNGTTDGNQTGNQTTNGDGNSATTLPNGDGTVVASKISDKMPQTGVIALGSIAAGIGAAALGLFGYKKFKENHDK